MGRGIYVRPRGKTPDHARSVATQITGAACKAVSAARRHASPGARSRSLGGSLSRGALPRVSDRAGLRPRGADRGASWRCPSRGRDSRSLGLGNAGTADRRPLARSAHDLVRRLADRPPGAAHPWTERFGQAARDVDAPLRDRGIRRPDLDRVVSKAATQRPRRRYKPFGAATTPARNSASRRSSS